MLLSSWKRPLSGMALILVLLAFVFSLGVHLAALGGLNAGLSAPGLVQVVRAGAMAGIVIAILGNIYLIWNKRWRATYTTLPIWFRLLMQWGVILLMGYWFAYSAATFSVYPASGDVAATVHLRDESCRWLLVYWVLLQMIIQISWGWNSFRSQRVPPLSAPR